MAAITADRARPEPDVLRTTFARLGIRRGEGRGPVVTWKAPGRVAIERALLHQVLPWAVAREMPAAWLRPAGGARAAGSLVIEHTKDVLVVDAPAA